MKHLHTLLAIAVFWLFTGCSGDVALTDVESSTLSENESSSSSSLSTNLSNQSSSLVDDDTDLSSEPEPDDTESSDESSVESSESSQTAVTESSDLATSSSSQTESSVSQPPEDNYDYPKIEAEDGTVAAGDVDMEGGGGWFIRTFQDGDIVQYADVDFGPNGAQSLVLHKAQAPDFTGATIDFIADSKDGTPFATIDVETTDGWDDFQSQINAISTPTGTHDLFIVAHHGGGAGDIDWFQFSSKEIKAPEQASNITLTSDDESVTATWEDNASDELSYNVYINGSATRPSSPSATLDADATTHTFENLFSGTTYHVWVEPVGEFLNADAVTANIKTTGEAPENSCLNVTHCADKNKGEWTLVVIPDTQHYSQDRNSAPIANMRAAFDWFVTIKDQLNIQFVQGLGDITEDWNQGWEWDNSMSAWEKLYNEIPFAVTTGNHDDPWTLNARFPVSNFDNESWWGGYFDGTFNSYQNFTFGNEDYLFMNVQSHDPWGNKYQENPAPINWANEIISANQNKKVILATHDTWETKEIEYNLLNKHDNIVLSNAGHTCQREAHYTTTGPNGGVSQNFITDYQCDANEVMLIRYYIFKPMENKVEFYTYSPVTDVFENDGDSQGSFSLEQKNP